MRLSRIPDAAAMPLELFSRTGINPRNELAVARWNDQCTSLYRAAEADCKIILFILIIIPLGAPRRNGERAV
jgi:hypothetical protein